MLILCPASSCDKPARSTSLNASISANSMNTGSWLLGGLGIKLVMGGMVPKVMGFGNLPLLPHLCLPRHIFQIIAFFSFNRLAICPYLLEPTLRLALQLSWRCSLVLWMVRCLVLHFQVYLGAFWFLVRVSSSFLLWVCYWNNMVQTLIYFCALSHNCNMCINTK